MAIRGILLDKDGTIIDYWRTWVPVNREAALYAARGDVTLAAELLRLGGHEPDTDRITPGAPLAAGDFMSIAEAFAAHPDVAPPTELWREREHFRPGRGAAFRTDRRRRRRPPGAAQARLPARHRHQRLRRGHRGLPGAARRRARLLRLPGGCHSGYGPKPGPGMALAFCAATGLAPPEVAVVGDAVHDLAMGRAAGVGLTVGVLSGTSGREDLADLADIILASVADLPALPALGQA